MRTPCMEAPEAWVGKDANLRAEAANVCKTACPVFEQCKAGTFPFIKPGPDDHGVWAGTDYSADTIKPTAATNSVSNAQTKECVACGVTVTRDKQNAHDWARLRYCSKKCYSKTIAVPGLPDSKQCEHCGAGFDREGRTPKHWMALRFCGNSCAGKARRKDAA